MHLSAVNHTSIFSKPRTWLIVLLLLTAAAGLGLACLRYAQNDETGYLLDAATIADCFRQGEWIGNQPVGWHGFLFKVPAALLFLLFGTSVYLATVTSIAFSLAALLLAFRLFRSVFKNDWWAVGGTVLVAGNYHFILGMPTFLREPALLLSCLLLFNALYTRRGTWLIGLILVLIVDAKEGVFFAFVPAVLLWVVLDESGWTGSAQTRTGWIVARRIMERWFKLLFPAGVWLFLMFFTGIIPLNMRNANILGLTTVGFHDMQFNFTPKRALEGRSPRAESGDQKAGNVGGRFQRAIGFERYPIMNKEQWLTVAGESLPPPLPRRVVEYWSTGKPTGCLFTLKRGLQPGNATVGVQPSGCFFQHAEACTPTYTYNRRHSVFMLVYFRAQLAIGNWLQLSSIHLNPASCTAHMHRPSGRKHSASSASASPQKTAAHSFNPRAHSALQPEGRIAVFQPRPLTTRFATLRPTHSALRTTRTTRPAGLGSLLHSLALYLLKITGTRAFSFISLTKFIVFPALWLSWLVVHKRGYTEHKQLLPLVLVLWCYLLIYILRMSTGRYLVPVLPLLVLFFIMFLRSVPGRAGQAAIVIGLTTATAVFALWYTPVYISVRIILSTASVSILGLYLLSSYRNWRSRWVWAAACILLLAAAGSGTGLASSVKIGQIGKYLRFGYNDQIADMMREVPEQQRVYISGFVSGGLLRFYRGQRSGSAEGTWQLQPWLPKKWLLETNPSDLSGFRFYSIDRFNDRIMRMGINWIVILRRNGDRKPTDTSLRRRRPDIVEECLQAGWLTLDRELEFKAKRLYIFRITDDDR